MITGSGSPGELMQKMHRVLQTLNTTILCFAEKAEFYIFIVLYFSSNPFSIQGSCITIRARRALRLNCCFSGKNCGSLSASMQHQGHCLFTGLEPRMNVQESIKFSKIEGDFLRSGPNWFMNQSIKP